MMPWQIAIVDNFCMNKPVQLIPLLCIVYHFPFKRSREGMQLIQCGHQMGDLKVGEMEF